MVAGMQQTSFGGSRLKHTKSSVPGPTLVRLAPARRHADRYRLLAQEIIDPLAADCCVTSFQSWKHLKKNSPRTASGAIRKRSAPFLGLPKRDQLEGMADLHWLRRQPNCSLSLSEKQQAAAAGLVCRCGEGLIKIKRRHELTFGRTHET
jgi:hypothetical protein